MTDFAWDIKQYRWLKDLVAELPVKAEWDITRKGKLVRVPITGITLHHTYIPTQAQWRGYSTMEGTGIYYISKGWSAGPHLFIAKDVPNPDHEGIWRGTPLDICGVHGGLCNSSRIGIEIVGNFDIKPWSDRLEHVVIETCVQLLLWMKQDESRVNGHRDCPSPKTCPGKMIDMDQVRLKIGRRLKEVCSGG